MSHAEYTAQMISEFGAELGLTEFGPDADGRASVTSGEMNCTFEIQNSPVEAVAIYIDIGSVLDDNPRTLRSLLEVSFQTWVTNVMTIGVDDAGERVIGQTLVPVVNLRPGTLRGVFDRIVAVGTRLQSRAV